MIKLKIASLGSAIVTAIAVPLVLALMAKIFPAKINESQLTEAMSVEEYFKVNRRMAPVFIISWALFGFIIWFILNSLYSAYTASYLDHKFFFGMPSNFTTVPALFLGIVAANWPVTIYLKYILGERFSAYNLAAALKYGKIADPKVYKISSIVITILILLVTVLAFRVMSIFDENSLLKCNLISCREWKYEEIAEIGYSYYSIAPNGSKVRRTDIYFRFKNGEFWSPGLFSNDSEALKVLNFVSEKTKLPIANPDILPEE